MRFLRYLQKAGYVPFAGAVDPDVYAYFRCPHPERAKWYLHYAQGSFQCVGCREYCETDDPKGFQCLLPLHWEDSCD
ncbi:MAG: DNA-binding protein [Thermodesulfobacteriota bacterium]